MSRKKRYVYDIETDNLLDDLTVVHCGVVYDLDTDEIWEFTPKNIHKLPQKLAQADEIWGHNIISFDNKAMAKVYPNEYLDYMQQFEGKEGERVFDSMVMSRLIWPDIKTMDYENLAKGSLELPPEPQAKLRLIGSHSLRAWGYRLGYFKGNADGEVDFATYTPEMLEYCKRDVLLNVKLIRTMEKKLPEWTSGDAPFHVWLEHQFYRYLEFQQSYGVGFDVEFAKFLCFHWEKELDKRLAEMRRMVPDILMETTIVPKTNNSKYGYEKGVPFVKRKVVKFNPRSGPHVVDFLTKKYQWEPTQFTKPSKKHPKGQPEVTFEVLKNLPYKEAPLLARIKLLMDRLKLVKKSQGGSAWLQCVKSDGRIYGGIIHNGTNTSRCRHVAPNLGNIVSTKSIWGGPLRKCFKARSGFKLVGVDADGLEMRCMSEVLYDYDGGAFYEMAFSGSKEDGTDCHSLNCDSIRKALEKAGYKVLAVYVTRDKSKTVFYAYIYGAWPKKLGMTVLEGIPVDILQAARITPMKYKVVGEAVKAGLVQNVKGLSELVAAMEEGYDQCLAQRQWPHIKMPDGRMTPVRKKSALFNTELQTRGAILCKLAPVLLMRKLIADPDFGLPGRVWFPVLHVHDEIQVEVKDEGTLITKFVEMATESFAEAGRMLGYRIPIVGSAAVGYNWAETH